MRPRFEVQFSVTVRDAGPEDVTALLTQLSAVVGKDVIQVRAPAVVLPAGIAESRSGGALLPVRHVRRWYRRPDAGEKRALVLEALRVEGWALSRAAERLQISRETLRRWMAALDLWEGEAA